MNKSCLLVHNVLTQIYEQCSEKLNFFSNFLLECGMKGLDYQSGRLFRFFLLLLLTTFRSCWTYCGSWLRRASSTA